MKRLRNQYRNSDKKIRFYACGEYGEDQNILTTQTLGRPHYHAILFNHDFADKTLLRTTDNGNLFESENLTKLWGMGHTSLAECSFATAAYVARYCMKKITGDDAEEHYQRVNETTGEITNIKPEFSTQSTKPGIGATWFEKYKSDCDKGYITEKGQKLPAPKYYKYLYEKYDDEKFMFVKRIWENNRPEKTRDDELDRLRVREQCKINQTKTLKRKLA